MDRVLGFEHGLPPAYAAVAALVGLTVLLFGWRLHRLTLALTGFVLGAFIGQLLAGWILLDRLWGFFVGGAILALLAEPLGRVMAFVLGGLAGGVLLGEGLHLSLGPGWFLWGFVPGALFGGLLSIWHLRTLVILASSILGAMVTWWGLVVAAKGLGLAGLGHFPARYPWLSLLIVALTGLLGVVLQWRFSPRSRGEGAEAESA